MLEKLQVIKSLTKEFIRTHKVEDETYGLCASLGLYGVVGDGLFALRYSIFETWEHYDPYLCTPTYPIPCALSYAEVTRHPKWDTSYYTHGKMSEFAYNYLPLYTGKALEYRVSLAKHVLNCVENEIDKLSKH